LLLLAFSAPISAVDLSKIDRKIGKEPVYTSQPKYCLLVLGPEAKTRVWLVQDGDTLYVDRNGNGDLTEEGEKVIGKADDPGHITFSAGDIREGTLLHRNLLVFVFERRAESDRRVKEYLAKNPGAPGYLFDIDLEMPGWKGTEIGGRVKHFVGDSDLYGFLKFADTPSDAPVVHFRGPLQVTLEKPQQMTVGRKMYLAVTIGTPGLGPGTTARVDGEGLVPEDAFPTVEVVFPPARAGEPPVRELYELKGHG
jgi:hypothetical protein